MTLISDQNDKVLSYTQIKIDDSNTIGLKYRKTRKIRIGKGAEQLSGLKQRYLKQSDLKEH